MVLARKKGKLPGATYSRTYDLEYGQDTVEIHKADLSQGDRVVIVDDRVATGGTLRATAELVAEIGAVVDEVFCVIGLPFLGYAASLAPIQVHTLIEFHSE
jgi:adenine phosphoribosyltransferase